MRLEEFSFDWKEIFPLKLEKGMCLILRQAQDD
jgi:hypothetical protein